MSAFDYKNLSNPLIYEENRLPPRATFDYYPDKLAADQAGVNEANPYQRSLDGLWKFHYARNLDQILPQCTERSYNCRYWDDIQVPAHMQFQGYGVPQYSNIAYPWDGYETVNSPNLPEQFNPVGTYVRYFVMPSDWKDDRTLIRFEGVESAYALWLNGHYVGYATDSFTASEFELTAYLEEGENKLVVQVFRFSSGSWMEDQDFFRFSGIFRSVYLMRVPALALHDLTIRTFLDDAFSYADIVVDCAVIGQADSLEFRLFDPAGVQIEQLSVKGDQARIRVNDPILWSAEEPALYRLEITLIGGGQSVGYLEEQVGIRRFEIVDGLMCINGKRIVFNGVNRHDFSGDFGRAVTRHDIYQDLITMKQNNINAIRTSHYPSRSLLYRLADELGFYVIAESNMETHGTWPGPDAVGRDFVDNIPGDRDIWKPMMLDRVTNTYHRDKNRPSVLIWSIGNESWRGTVVQAMAERFRELDATRLVHYEGDYSNSYNTTDMLSRMYFPATKVEEFVAEHPEMPFILCEYTHAMGNSCGGMHKYTDLVDRLPRFQGGFIWDYIDQTILTKNSNGQSYRGYGGDFDDRPNDNNFSGNGIVFSDHSETPKMQEVKANYQPLVFTMSEAGFEVFNRSLFTNTEVWRCVVSLSCQGNLLEEVDIDTAVEAGERAFFAWPFEKKMEAGEYVLTVSFRLRQETEWADADHEIAWGQAVYQLEMAETVNELRTSLLPSRYAASPRLDGGAQSLSDASELTLNIGLHNIGVVGQHFSLLFSLRQGGLTSYRYGGKELLQRVVRPSFWRAPTDNDIGNGLPQRAGMWKIASRYAVLGGGYEKSIFPVANVNEDGTVTVRLHYDLPTVPNSSCVMVYTVHLDGHVRVDLEMDARAVEAPLPEFGVQFTMKADYDRLTWYGLGPAETYSDRRRGGKLDLWEGLVEDQLAAYPKPQESGAHQEVRWARVMNHRGSGLLFCADPNGLGISPTQGGQVSADVKGGMVVSALPYSPEEIENAEHLTELPVYNNTTVRVLGQQHGVGGDDSWGAETLREYWIDTSDVLSFSFSFRAVI